MKVRALDSFTGDWPGSPTTHYRKGGTFEVPDRIGRLWISEGLVEAARVETRKTKGGEDHG